jgi:uncharacterized protein YggE
MRRVWLTALLLACASLVFGQLETDTMTIQASRSVTLTPDQVSFYITVTADPANSLDQIVAALSGLGITASNLSGMYGAMDNQSSLQWSFTLATPLTKVSATIASLITLQQSMVKNNSGMSLTFQMQGAYVSPQAFQSQSCSTKDLVADAQAQAQRVAAAAGLAIGQIVAISDGSSFAVAPTYPALAFRGGDFSTGTGTWFNTAGFSSYAIPSGCYIEVKFKLLRYQ